MLIHKPTNSIHKGQNSLQKKKKKTFAWKCKKAVYVVHVLLDTSI